jgi:hypothetical protein
MCGGAVVCNSSTISPRCFGQLKYKEAAFQFQSAGNIILYHTDSVCITRVPCIPFQSPRFAFGRIQIYFNLYIVQYIYLYIVQVWGVASGGVVRPAVRVG